MPVVGSGEQREAATCASGGLTATPFDYAGPFWKAGAPELGAHGNIREPGDGPFLLLNISVVDTQCNLLPGAKIDLWHTNAAGKYGDEIGDPAARYNYTGILFADIDGHALLETVIPARPPVRPICHIHVRYNKPGGPVHVTQIYFPGASGNNPSQSMSGLDPSMFVHVLSNDAQQNMVATFQFVIP